MMPALALLLFDIDGCTAVVPVSKLLFKKKIDVSTRCQLVMGKKSFLVEVIKIGTTKAQLEEYEDTVFNNSTRAKAIDKELKGRNGREHGILDIKSEKKTQPKGTNGRSLHVLYEGSADSSTPLEEPVREPAFTAHLTVDQRELLEMQLQQHANGSGRNTGTQTKTVVILSSDQDIKDLCKRPESSDVECLTKPDTKDFSCQVNIQTHTDMLLEKILQTLQISHSKIATAPPTPQAIESFTEDFMDFLQMETLSRKDHPASSSPELDIYTPSFQDFEDEDDKTPEVLHTTGILDDLPLLNRPRKHQTITTTNNTTTEHITVNTDTEHIMPDTEDITTGTEHNTATTEHNTNTRDSEQIIITTNQTATNIHRNNTSNNSTSTPDREDITTTDAEHNSDTQEHNSYTQEHNSNTTDNNTNTIKTNQAATSIRNDSTSTFICYPGPIQEISSWQDITNACQEVRISRARQQAVDGATSTRSSYLWKLAQDIYRKDELIGRNYYGRKGKLALSPRRRHALEHVVADCYGNTTSNMKDLVKFVNTGIRNISRTPKI